MSSPFFDTRETERLRLAANIVAYPLEFCLSEKNRELIVTTVAGRVDLLVAALSDAQMAVRQSQNEHDYEQIWAGRDAFLHNVSIRSAPIVPTTWPKVLEFGKLHSQLNLGLLDDVIDEAYRLRNKPETKGTPDQASVCLWLSDHLALLVLGMAHLAYRAHDQTLLIQPASEDVRRHLRCLWFGAAFDEQSIKAANAVLESLVAKCLYPKDIQADFPMLHAAVLAIFPQHWRLPADTGPVADLLEATLKPIVHLLVNVLAADVSKQGRPFMRIDAVQINAVEQFDFIVETAKNKSPTEYLFLVQGGGIVPGKRILARGMIELAEEIANIKLGKDWHAVASGFQKAYVIERLRKNDSLDVIDFELNQHHTTNNQVPVDVDFWVRARSGRHLYAIQLKHLESTKKGGLAYWMGRLRARDGGLGKGVLQLENLKRLVKEDQQVQRHLLSNGLDVEELNRIHPVLLHNVGSMDFWELQEGVLLYDVHTFCNVLDGRSATALHAENRKISHQHFAGNQEAAVVPHDPESVIAAYLADPKFIDLKHFDAVKRLRRSVAMPTYTVEAKGLGIWIDECVPIRLCCAGIRRDRW